MGTHVDRAFIHFLVRQHYIDKGNHHRFFCCLNCKRLDNLLNEMDRWSFHDLNQFHNKWFLIIHRKYDRQITLFPVFI